MMLKVTMSRNKEILGLSEVLARPNRPFLRSRWQYFCHSVISWKNLSKSWRFCEDKQGLSEVTKR